MRHVIIRDKATRETRKKVPCTTGIGFAWVPDGQEEIEYEITLDAAGMNKIVMRAASNANGTSVRGPLRARITNRRKI